MSISRKIVFNVPSLLPEPRSPPRGGAPPPSPAGEPGQRETAADVRKLAMLVEVSQALTGTLNLQAGLYGALEVLERRCRAVRGAVTLLEEDSGMLAVEAALGYPRPAGRVRYRLGEGVTGMVAQTGTPRSGAPGEPGAALPPPRGGAGQRGGEITFICVPITLDGATAGTLGIEQAFVDEPGPRADGQGAAHHGRHDRAGAPHPAADRRRAPQAGGGEHRSSARSCGSATSSPT